MASASPTSSAAETPVPVTMDTVLAKLLPTITAVNNDYVPTDKEGKCAGGCYAACEDIQRAVKSIGLKGIRLGKVHLSVFADGWEFPTVKGMEHLSRFTSKTIITVPDVSRIDWDGSRENFCEICLFFISHPLMEQLQIQLEYRCPLLPLD